MLVRSRNPLNIGAAARAMSNFGFRTLRLVTPWEPSYAEARSAVGAAEVLQNAELYGSVAEAVADCSLVVGTSALGERELQHPVHMLDDGGELICRKLTHAPAAILFGSEKTGLSNDELSHCHWLMRIPTRQEHISMNLGQAVAVTLYELARQAAVRSELCKPAAVSASGDASAAELERLTQLFFDLLSASGYLRSSSNSAASSTDEKLRRMMHRLRLNHTDAETLTGMLRKILWKLQQ